MDKATEFTIYSGGKWRTFSDPSFKLRSDIDEVSTELLNMFPDLKGPARKIQSRLDIRYYQKYDFVELMDVKKALLSGNVLTICLFSTLFYPRTVKLTHKILKIYSAPVYDDKNKVLDGRANRLKAGYKTSELILALAFRPWLQLFKRLGGECNLYVDDLILFSSNQIMLNFFSSCLRSYFYILGFRFHKREFYNLASKPRNCGARLGLLFNFTRNGSLETKIRSRTLKRYLKRITFIAKTCTLEIALAKICRSLYQSEFYPLYESFDRSIWTSQIQRIQFFSRCCGILKKTYPEVRKLKKVQLAELIWAHRVIS